jgi:crossover junction endodeoxyribonuclease RuvC
MARDRRFELPQMGVVGVDPGRASGSVSYVCGAESWSWSLSACTEQELWEVFEKLATVAGFAVLERVNAMPRQGVASSFKFGTSYGELRAFLVASRLRFHLVTPTTWQRKMGCLSKGDKKVTRALAQSLFPGVKVTHTNADSLLLAEYGRRNLE